MLLVRKPHSPLNNTCTAIDLAYPAEQDDVKTLLQKIQFPLVARQRDQAGTDLKISSLLARSHGAERYVQAAGGKGEGEKRHRLYPWPTLHPIKDVLIGAIVT